MADGHSRHITKQITLTIETGALKGNNTFLVLLELKQDLILGVKLLRRIGFSWGMSLANPPVAELAAVEPPTNPAGLAQCSPAQKVQLQALLDEFIPAFEAITGGTPLATHRLKEEQEPMRQRYRTFIRRCKKL